MLQSFAVEGFRTFSSLQVDRLSRVNLIVGRNTVGKTCILEALRLYATRAAPEAIRNLLLERDEVEFDLGREERQLLVGSLFHGRSMSYANGQGIRMGPLGDSEAQLSIRAGFVRRVPLEDSEFDTGYRFEEMREPKESDADVEMVLVIDDAGTRRFVHLNRFEARYRSRHETAPAFVSALGATEKTIAQWWDSISLRQSEERVIECLRMIAPIERISLVEHPWGRRERRVMVRMEGQAEPVPLKALGDGVVHMFHLALAFEFTGILHDSQQGRLFDETSERSRFLLIDEVENGIHYTLLARLWSFIFKLAKFHQVQVFATSHSWDCIEGFQQAAKADEKAEGTLIRLEKADDRTRAIVFDEDELAIVTREKIEVR